jgi:hypothetical protein
MKTREKRYLLMKAYQRRYPKMQLVTHKSQLDHLKPCPVSSHISARFYQLSEDTDLPPCIILVEPDDDLTGPAYSLLGDYGVFTNIYGTSVLSEDNNISIFDSIAYLPTAAVFEMLYIEGGLGYWFVVPDEVVKKQPRLKTMIDSQELSHPQPFS